MTINFHFSCLLSSFSLVTWQMMTSHAQDPLQQFDWRSKLKVETEKHWFVYVEAFVFKVLVEADTQTIPLCLKLMFQKLSVEKFTQVILVNSTKPQVSKVHILVKDLLFQIESNTPDFLTYSLYLVKDSYFSWKLQLASVLRCIVSIVDAKVMGDLNICDYYFSVSSITSQKLCQKHLYCFKFCGIFSILLFIHRGLLSSL